MLAQFLLLMYTREGHRPDLLDLLFLKRLKTVHAGAEIYDTGPLGGLLVRSVDNVVLVEVTTGVFAISTARETNNRSYNVLVPSDCCAEPMRENH